MRAVVDGGTGAGEAVLTGSSLAYVGAPAAIAAPVVKALSSISIELAFTGVGEQAACLAGRHMQAWRSCACLAPPTHWASLSGPALRCRPAQPTPSAMCCKCWATAVDLCWMAAASR